MHSTISIVADLQVSGQNEKPKRIVCYYNSLGEQALMVKDIDPYLCTHVIYGFVGIHPNLTVLRPFTEESIANSE